MIEKTNLYHPDKVADRIAGAIVDLAYTKQENPKVAVECLLGHGECNIIIESSVKFTQKQIEKIVHRITEEENITVTLKSVPQDENLARNQSEKVRCGDNGIFKGVELSEEEIWMSKLARYITKDYPYDGKYIYDEKSKRLIICQSHMTDEETADLTTYFSDCGLDVSVNPIGSWTGGINTDSGAVNRKLGSDMARSVSGGGIHGKDLSKMDVSANIYAFMKAQEYSKPVELFCAIGDENLVCRIGNKETVVSVDEVVSYAKDVVKGLGGFEALAEWGLY